MTCCRFLRLTHIPEEEGLCMTSSNHRHARAAQFSAPEGREDLITLLSDTEDPMYPFFRESTDEDFVKTVAVGECLVNPLSLGGISTIFLLTNRKHFYSVFRRPYCHLQRDINSTY